MTFIQNLSGEWLNADIIGLFSIYNNSINITEIEYREGSIVSYKFLDIKDLDKYNEIPVKRYKEVLEYILDNIIYDLNIHYNVSWKRINEWVEEWFDEINVSK